MAESHVIARPQPSVSETRQARVREYDHEEDHRHRRDWRGLREEAPGYRHQDGGAASRAGRRPRDARICEKTGIPHALILRWVNHADLIRIVGVAEQFAELLEASGVDSIPELAHGSRPTCTPRWSRSTSRSIWSGGFRRRARSPPGSTSARAYPAPCFIEHSGCVAEASCGGRSGRSLVPLASRWTGSRDAGGRDGSGSGVFQHDTRASTSRPKRRPASIRPTSTKLPILPCRAWSSSMGSCCKERTRPAQVRAKAGSV